MNYWESIDKMISVAPSYAHLPLPELLMNALTEGGYSREKAQTMLDNVYINEVVHLPDSVGFLEYKGEYWFWSYNERNQLSANKFDDAAEMVLSFSLTAGSYAKSPYDHGGFRVRIENFVQDLEQLEKSSNH